MEDRHMKISVILTSYNHERFLRQSIDSVLNQTYQDFEFIIVDDFSKDSSWDIICEYKEKNPKLITIRHEYNWGGGSIEDVVKNHASGDYIAIHHSDDVWEKDKLQKQVDAMQSVPNCAAVFTNASAIDDDGRPYGDETGFYFELFSVKNRSRYEWLNHFFYKGNCLCHPSVLIKKNVYMEDGFFRKGLKQIPDFVKWIQVCKKHEIYVIPDALVKFRIHEEGKNTSGLRADTQIRSTIELFLMLDEFVTITNKDDFLKIFPEARKYCTDDFFSVEYALGRICCEKGMPAYTRLYGDRLLYKALNDPVIAYNLEKNFCYTKKEYSKDTGRHDIFGVLPKAFEQTRSIYVDRGQGFSEYEVYRKSYVLADQEEFAWNCTIDSQEQEIINLRFDPAENVLTKVELYNVSINGESVRFQGDNAFCTKNGSEIFINLDPIYSIIIPKQFEGLKQLEILIEGKVTRLTDEELGQLVTLSIYENREIVRSYEGDLRSLKEDVKRLEEDKNKMQMRLTKLENTLIYKLYAKFIRKMLNKNY